ncbi:hypothetical protein GJ744_010706 [Endocarpon pusillum]|uniref:Uncharacterized protein n=1 Tax=Endocarpon pusillum TaxID=364733 RepID=A0A8H7AG52_9EURO|nr:hypothetical protein GJ744_010706 [Endocarpon pusillum]
MPNGSVPNGPCRMDLAEWTLPNGPCRMDLSEAIPVQNLRSLHSQIESGRTSLRPLNASIDGTEQYIEDSEAEDSEVAGAVWKRLGRHGKEVLGMLYNPTQHNAM